MNVRIKCTTLFDITATGVKNRFHKSRLPFNDNTGKMITSDHEWQRSRNQQCNWETVNQVISLRTLPENISTPKLIGNKWMFEFTVVDPDTIHRDGDPVAALKDDCIGVPMVLGLLESDNLDPLLMPSVNIWFESITTE